MTTKQPTYTPEQVEQAFEAITENLNIIEQAYNEAIGTAAKEPFMCWDATAPGYLEAQGLPRLITPSESNWFPGDARGAPDLDWIKENAVPKFADEDPLVIDIECYGKKDNPDDPAPTTAQEVEYLRSVVEVHQQGVPGQRVGVYSYPPERYGGCATCGPDDYDERWGNWTDRNALFAPLAEQVYAIFPSLYGLYSDMDTWVKFAQQNVEQARMLAPGKQVIGYLWPEWHNNAAPEASGPIDYDSWMIMLETCLGCCDGIAIWHWSSSRFDPDAPWWRATEDFMAKHHLNGR